MTGTAVLRDGLLVRSGVSVIVAAEAAGRIRVAEIIDVSSPSDFEIRKDIAAIDGSEGRAGGVDLALLRGRHVGVRSSVERAELARDFVGRLIA